MKPVAHYGPKPETLMSPLGQSDRALENEGWKRSEKSAASQKRKNRTRNHAFAKEQSTRIKTQFHKRIVSDRFQTIHATQDFLSWWSQEVAQEKRKSLGPKAAVLLVLAIHANSERQAWPGIKRIASHSGFVERTVTRAIQELSEMGLITVTPKAGMGRHRGRTNLYEIRIDRFCEIMGIGDQTYEEPCTKEANSKDSTNFYDDFII